MADEIKGFKLRQVSVDAECYPSPVSHEHRADSRWIN
jgi:hypothetical protein